MIRRFLRGPIYYGLVFGTGLLLLILSRLDHVAAGEITDTVRGGYFSGGALLAIVGLRLVTARFFPSATQAASEDA